MLKKILWRIYVRFLIGIMFFIALFFGYRGGFFSPTVSVVMPVYNREEMVGDAIESILRQSFQDFELVVVDDGSTDNTLDVIKQYAQKDSRIKIVAHEKNCGVGCARNTAQRHAKGKYLAVMDSDDIMADGRLARQVAAMESNPDLTVLNGQILKYDELEYHQEPKYGYTLTNNETTFPICMFFTNCFANVSSMIRRDFVIKNNIRYDETLDVGEDYDYWMQIIFAGGKMAGLRETLVWIRHTPGSAMSSPKAIENALEVKGRYFEKILGKNRLDLKWEYILPERCDIVAQFIKSKSWHAFLNAETVENWYQKACAPDVSNKIYVEHLYWSDFVKLKENKRFARNQVKDEGVYDIVDGVITLKWDNYNPEQFKLDEKGVYRFINPDEKTFELKHPNWSDIVKVFENRLCRTSVTDCATVLKQTEDIITVKWDMYGKETFKYSSKTKKYEFVN